MKPLNKKAKNANGILYIFFYFFFSWKGMFFIILKKNIIHFLTNKKGPQHKMSKTNNTKFYIQILFFIFIVISLFLVAEGHVFFILIFFTQKEHLQCKISENKSLFWTSVFLFNFCMGLHWWTTTTRISWEPNFMFILRNAWWGCVRPNTYYSISISWIKYN